MTHPGDVESAGREKASLDVALTPLAMPILAGPGTVATAMNYASAGTVSEFVVTAGAFALLCLITFAFFVSGERVVARVGEGGLKVVTRIMGLILAVIGVQMLLHGVGGAVKTFLTPGAA